MTITILTPSLGPSVRPPGETTQCGYATTGAEGQEWLVLGHDGVRIGPAGLSGGKDDASMRFSRAWLAAVPALAIALTGGVALAAAASPAPAAAKSAAEIAQAVREPAAGTAHPRVVVFNCLGQPQIRPGRSRLSRSLLLAPGRRRPPRPRLRSARWPAPARRLARHVRISSKRHPFLQDVRPGRSGRGRGREQATPVPPAGWCVSAPRCFAR